VWVAATTPVAGQDLSDPVKRQQIDEQLMVSLDAVPSETGAATYVIRYRNRPRSTSRQLASGQVFTASEQVQLTYPKFNPLRVQVTAAVTSAPDPGFTSLTRVVDALLSTAGILRPDKDPQNIADGIRDERKKDAALPAEAATVTCSVESLKSKRAAQDYLTQLTNILYDPDLDAAALLGP
jgi:hypothetical protein